jgi:2,4-dienoyl-CoA reductase-like NADH-dependent reductase (Old Yellow Enzyme family)
MNKGFEIISFRGLIMSRLFDPFRIGYMEIQNRFMRSPTTSAWSDEKGILRSEIITHHRRLAEGGVGLIIKGHTYVKDSGKAHVGMAGISSDIHIPKLRELTDAVHKYEGKIIAQLNYGGYNSMVDRAGPSPLKTADYVARGLSLDEIHDIVDAFGKAALRAMDSGFDGIQIHGAHGYLISQFLSQLVNKRNDDYGGSLKNRMRLLNDVYDEVRAHVGGCIPVLIKMNCDDFSSNGFTIEDGIKVASAIARRGIDLIEVSGGGFARQIELYERARSHDRDLAEATFSGHAVKIRAVTKPTPMALVHGIRSMKCMKAIIEKDVADIISMSRPFIKEPNLVRRLEGGQQEASCISCDACRSVFGKEMMSCQAT